MIALDPLKHPPVVSRNEHCVTVESAAFLRPFNLSFAESLRAADYLRRFADQLERAGRAGAE